MNPLGVPSLQQVGGPKGNGPIPAQNYTSPFSWHSGGERRKRNSLYIFHVVPFHLDALLRIKMIPSHAY